MVGRTSKKQESRPTEKHNSSQELVVIFGEDNLLAHKKSLEYFKRFLDNIGANLRLLSAPKPSELSEIQDRVDMIYGFLKSYEEGNLSSQDLKKMSDVMLNQVNNLINNSKDKKDQEFLKDLKQNVENLSTVKLSDFQMGMNEIFKSVVSDTNKKLEENQSFNLKDILENKMIDMERVMKVDPDGTSTKINYGYFLTSSLIKIAGMKLQNLSQTPEKPQPHINEKVKDVAVSFIGNLDEKFKANFPNVVATLKDKINSEIGADKVIKPRQSHVEVVKSSAKVSKVARG